MIELPVEFRAGTSLSLRYTLTAYPADQGWTLKLALRGPAVLDLTGTADGVGHVVEASATATAAWAHGTYAWAARLEGPDSEVVDAGSGTLLIERNLAAVSTVMDATSHAQRTLTAIEAAIEGRASKDQQSYKIGNRELVRIPIAELLRLRSVYRAEVARERRAASGMGGLFGQHVRVRF